jgi:hypothetical protein
VNIKILKPSSPSGETDESKTSMSCQDSEADVSSFDRFTYLNKQLASRYDRYMEAVNTLTCLLRWEEAIRQGESVHIPSFVSNYEVNGRSVVLRLRLDTLEPDVLLALISQLTSTVASEVSRHAGELLQICETLQRFYQALQSGVKEEGDGSAGNQSG